MHRIFILVMFFLFTHQLYASDGRERLVKSAVNEAIKVIDKALTRNSPMQETLLQMRESFGDVQWLPRGQSYPHCEMKPSVRAYVQVGATTIHLCSSLFEEEWDRDSMAQILIHESTHVSGILNECSATKYEIGALKLAKKSISFQSDYWKECLITTKFDPFQIVGTTDP